MNVAIHYSGGDKGKQMPTVFKIGIGAINRGASLTFCSQYAGEVIFPNIALLSPSTDVPLFELGLQRDLNNY